MTVQRFQRIFLVLLLAFAGVLSVSGTIALRNVLHLVLLALLTVFVFHAWPGTRERMGSAIGNTPRLVGVWIVYLLLFPLIAPDRQGAWSNLIGKGMWGESILTWVLALGSWLVLSERRITLWTLALVSAVPVYIHLILTLMAWAGVLQPEFYAEPSLQSAWGSVLSLFSHASATPSAFGDFPMGFRGIEPMHGNLGYPASQAMCLGVAVFFAAWHHGERGKAAQAGVLVAACFLSVVVAQSRAAAYFGLLIIGFAVVAYLVVRRGQGNARRRIGLVPALAAVGAAALCLAFFIQVVSSHPAWYSMWDKMTIGFQIKAPEQLLCDGFTPATTEFVHAMHSDKDPEYVEALVDGLRGDGGRVLLARVGAELSAKNLWGWNGGRDAYAHRIGEYCGHLPMIVFSHAHNAWINLLLAIGWIGAALYAGVLASFFISGWSALKYSQAWPAGMALLLLGGFWMLRGMVDAVYQEHYLQMRAFFLLTLHFIVQSNKPAAQ